MTKKTETNMAPYGSGSDELAEEIQAIEDSPVARALFSEVRWAWIWLLLRLYIGWEWLHSAWQKINSAAWTGSNAGTAISGFVSGALDKTSGAHPDVQLWYAAFLRDVVLSHPVTWSYVITGGELVVGLALILGVFTGIAAFFGSFMNINYLLAGSVSINPILFVLAAWLVLAWKTAGWWGIDRWLLPALGTPWRPGYVVNSPSAAADAGKQSRSQDSAHWAKPANTHVAHRTGH